MNCILTAEAAGNSEKDIESLLSTLFWGNNTRYPKVVNPGKKKHRTVRVVLGVPGVLGVLGGKKQNIADSQ